jgi:hypothetical protein
MTDWLVSSSMHNWNFGSLSQRFDLDNWDAIFQRLTTQLLPWLWPFAIVSLFGLWRLESTLRALLLGSVLGSGAVIAIFFNLYVKHDYYLSAVFLPLCFAAGSGLFLTCRLMNNKSIEGAVLLFLGFILISTSLSSPFVQHSYKRHLYNEILEIGKTVQSFSEEDDILLVVGDDWNARIPYYARRKSIMIRKPSEESSEEWRHALDSRAQLAVVAKDAASAIQRLFPNGKIVLETQEFSVFRLGRN